MLGTAPRRRSQRMTGAAYDEVFESGAQQANVWQWGMDGCFMPRAWPITPTNRARPVIRTTVFDARVGVVKSALALGGYAD
ncbi:hypothetical protein DK37_08580, partial [Halomonas sp. SUBG004]